MCFQWSERRRLEIAELLSIVLTAHLYAYDPVFSMSLRYLIRLSFRYAAYFCWIFFFIVFMHSCARFIVICFNVPYPFSLFSCLRIYSIHKGFFFCQGMLSPISDLTEKLLLEVCDPPAAPKESSYEAPPFDEVRF